MNEDATTEVVEAAPSGHAAGGPVRPGARYDDDPESVRVWSEALADPAFKAAMEEATDPTVHHHFYKWSEVKAERDGGPPPTCTSCGEPAPATIPNPDGLRCFAGCPHTADEPNCSRQPEPHS